MRSPDGRTHPQARAGAIEPSRRRPGRRVGLRTREAGTAAAMLYMMAGSLVAVMPTILVVILLQRSLVRGFAFTAFGGR